MTKHGNWLVKNKPSGKWQFLDESDSLAPSRASPLPTVKRAGTEGDSPASQGAGKDTQAERHPMVPDVEVTLHRRQPHGQATGPPQSRLVHLRDCGSPSG